MKGDIARRMEASRATTQRRGSLSQYFLEAPACAVPEHQSSGAMSFVRSRSKASGFIGGSYGEIFFGSGAGTRGAVKTASSQDNAGGGTNGSSSGAATAPGNGGGSSNGPGNSKAGAAGAPSAADDPANGSVPPDALTDFPKVNDPFGGAGAPAGGAPVGGVKPSAVNPEPSTWLLFGTALFGLLFVRARQTGPQV
jgi:hypothetical protein